MRIDSLWAKDTGESLAEHTDKCLAIWDCLWLERKQIYSRLAHKLGLDGENLNHLIRDTIICHDLGKGTLPWQKFIRNQENHKKITHSLYSFYLFGEIKDWPKDQYFLASSLAILAHHQMLHNNSYQNDSFNSKEKIYVCSEQLMDFLNPRMNFKGKIFPEIISYQAVQKVQILKKMTNKILQRQAIKFKSLFAFLLAILTYVDHEASRKNYKWRSLKDTWEGFEKSSIGSSPNRLQQNILEKAEAGEENFLVQAGCGTGKTGAALWAGYKLYKQGKTDKMIITLPTKFTSNSMYWDFISSEKYNFSVEDVGIFHSEVESLLIKENETEEEDYVNIEKRINCWYAKPLNISTIDHLLYSLLHCYRYSDRAFGHLQTSLIVFDEIHYYDEYLLAKIGQCIQILRKLGIPHIIMSATLPNSLQDALKEQVSITEANYVAINQNNNENEDVPCKIHLMDKPLLQGQNVNRNFLELIGENINYRQMVVVNQVERAKTIMKEIKFKYKNINIICYHSQFTREDREIKEWLIKTLFKNSTERSKDEIQLLEEWGFVNSDQVILVTTQICELSLDISAHVMYSEIAPIDGLVQRAGRLHRKGKHYTVSQCTCPICKSGTIPDSFCYTFYIYPINWQESYELLPYGFDPEDNILRYSWSILENDKEKFLTVRASLNWINKLYPQKPRLVDMNMLKAIEEDLVFGKKPKERFGDPEKENSQGSFKVREEILPTFLVVPASLYDEKLEITDLLKNKSVRVSRKRVFNEKDKLNRKGEVFVLNIPYSSEVGFEFSLI